MAIFNQIKCNDVHGFMLYNKNFGFETDLCNRLKVNQEHEY